MIYIDYDGVVQDTYPLVFKSNPNIKDYTKEQITKYLRNIDWYLVMHTAREIDEAFYVLRNIDYKNTKILTKCSANLPEYYAKIYRLKEENVKQEVIYVPFHVSKTRVANPYSNTLIDDTVKNCNEWKKCGGKSIFFDTDGDGIDEWNEKNIYHTKVRSLKFLMSRYK